MRREAKRGSSVGALAPTDIIVQRLHAIERRDARAASATSNRGDGWSWSACSRRRPTTWGRTPALMNVMALPDGDSQRSVEGTPRPHFPNYERCRIQARRLRAEHDQPVASATTL